MRKLIIPLMLLLLLPIVSVAQERELNLTLSDQFIRDVRDAFANESDFIEEVRYAITQDDNQINVFGTEYIPGDQARVFLQLLDTNTPVNNASCKIDIWNPNGTLLFNDAAMVFQIGSDGLYFFDLTAPDTEGIYMVTADCLFADVEFWFYNPDFFPEITAQPRFIPTFGTPVGTPGAMNQFDDALYVEHASSTGSPKEVAFQMEWNLSLSPIPPSVENASDLTLFYSGEASTVTTAIFFIFNFTADAFQQLDNVLVFDGTAGGSPRGIAEFASNSVSGNLSDFVSENNTVLVSFDATAGSSFTVFHNWMNIRFTSLEDESINEIRGGGEMHVSGKEDAEFITGVCAQNQTEAVMLGLFILLSILVVGIGIASRIGFIGFFGGVLLFISSWSVLPCIVILGKAMFWLALLIMIYFIGNALWPKSNPTFVRK